VGREAGEASLPPYPYNKFFIVIPNLPAAGRQSEESLQGINVLSFDGAAIFYPGFLSENESEFYM